MLWHLSRLVSIALICVFLLGACQRDKQILLVGNSLSYTNNLPAVLEALASANGKNLRVDLLASPGSTLEDNIANKSFEHAITAEAYEVIALQEKGGILYCPQSYPEHFEQCVASRAAHAHMAHLGQNIGAQMVVLGTVQPVARVSKQLETNELEVGGTIDAAGVLSISQAINKSKVEFPQQEWLHRDGAHPGNMTTLVVAVSLFRFIYSEDPELTEVHVAGIDLEPNAPFRSGELIAGPWVDQEGGRKISIDNLRLAIIISKNVVNFGCSHSSSKEGNICKF